MLEETVIPVIREDGDQQGSLLKALSLDTETNGKDPRHDPDFKLLGLSYAKDNGTNAEYLPVGHIGKGNLDVGFVLRRMHELLDSCNTIVFHNAKFDLLTLKRGLGLDLYGSNWYDTMLIQHFIDENLPNKSLDFLGKYHFNETKVHDERMKTIINGPGWGFIPAWLISDYAIQDAKLTLKLFYKLYPLFERQGFNG